MAESIKPVRLLRHSELSRMFRMLTPMPRSILLSIVGAFLLFPGLADAEPLSYYSCDIAQEKLVKAQRTLNAADTKLRHLQRDEALIRTELWACSPGEVVSLARTRRCGRAQHGLPAFMKQTIEATYRVDELQQAVHERHDWQKKVCEVTE